MIFLYGLCGRFRNYLSIRRLYIYRQVARIWLACAFRNALPYILSHVLVIFTFVLYCHYGSNFTLKLVPITGVEPVRLSALDLKPSASANSAIWGQKSFLVTVYLHTGVKYTILKLTSHDTSLAPGCSPLRGGARHIKRFLSLLGRPPSHGVATQNRTKL